MNNKKGFTLIEVLAVIVIIGVLAVVTIPQVGRVISDTKKSSAKDSFNSYMRAVDQFIIDSESDSVKKGYINSHFNILSTLSITGSKATSGYIYVNSDKSVSARFVVDDYCFSKKRTSKNADVEVLDKEECSKTYYDNGMSIYFDVTTGSKCSLDKTNSNDNNITGCMKWYVINDDPTSPVVDLVLDHNIGNTAWNTSESNTSGVGTELMTVLNSTSSWAGIDTRTDKYSYNGYNISYSSSKARLLTLDDINRILGLSLDGSSDYLFETINKDTYGWLNDRTSTVCEEYGCFYNSSINTLINPSMTASENGYWLGTSAKGSTANAITISQKGIETKNSTKSISGVRPVITISKTLIF